jgi:ethanolamine transporter
MISGFNAFGNGVTIFITAVTAIAIFEYNTGIRFPLFDTMVDYDGGSPLESGLLVCGQIAITLAGAYPMVKFVSDTFGKALAKVVTALGMNAAAPPVWSRTSPTTLQCSTSFPR